MPAEAAPPTDGDSLPRRVVTAVVAILAAVVATLTLATWIVALVLGIIAVGASIEWIRVVTGRRASGRGFALIVAGSLSLLWFAGSWWIDWLQLLCLVSLVWWCIALVWVVRFEQGVDATALDGAITRGVVGWLIIVPAWAGLVSLHASGEDGPWGMLFVLLVVWAADIGAYFTGRRFGARRLAVITSPGKSVEGAAGGIAAVAVLGAGTGLGLGLSVRLIILFTVLCVAVAVLSVLGDLMESLVKRRSGVKDSGNLLPGHGGILDRIDSLTAAAPAFAIGWDILGILR